MRQPRLPMEQHHPRGISVDSSAGVAGRRTPLATITIRNLDDEIKQRLRVRAAEHGRSMEEEARDILRRVMSESASPRDLTAAIRARVARGARADLELPAREPMREPPQLGPQSR